MSQTQTIFEGLEYRHESAVRKVARVAAFDAVEQGVAHANVGERCSSHHMMIARIECDVSHAVYHHG